MAAQARRSPRPTTTDVVRRSLPALGSEIRQEVGAVKAKIRDAVAERPAASEVHREYRQLADLYVESGFDRELGRQLDDFFRRRLTVTQNGHESPPRAPARANGNESRKRAERRRVQDAADRRRIAEALEENPAQNTRTIAKKLGVSDRLVARVRADGLKARLCGCGCGRKFAPTDPRQRFVDAGHRQTFHDRKRRK